MTNNELYSICTTMPDRSRRKSLSIFQPELAALTPINEPRDYAPAGGLLKKRRPGSLFSSSPSSSPTSSEIPPSSPLTPIKRTDSQSSLNRLLSKSRPRSLQKTGRPNSILGNFRNSLYSSQEDDDDDGNLERVTSKNSVHSTASTPNVIYGTKVLNHGEIQTAGGVFRKKSAYFVLTDTHLVRFKSQERALDTFPSIPSSIGRASTMRHSRMSSSGSLHELHTLSSGESHHGIDLHDIISVWRPEDAKPYFSVEIDYSDDEASNAGSMTLQLYDPNEADVWTSSIRTAVTNARLAEPRPYAQYLQDYTTRALDQEGDYEPSKFLMFKVIQRMRRSGPNSSSEDLTKMSSMASILAIGAHKVHLIPFPRSSRTASNTSLSDLNVTSYALMTLTQLNVHERDDAFSLNFRLPFRQYQTLSLASSLVSDIALNIRNSADFLRPLWLEAPFTWNVPSGLDEEIWDIPTFEEVDQGYFRTLIAYCAAYGVDVSRIRYTVHEDCEDAPAFELLSPTDRDRPKYTALELLAIMRALRYNESFTTLDFRNISLDVLHTLRDRYGNDHVPWSTKSGEPLNIIDQENSTLLVQEVRALAVKSRRLRRLDFSYCVTRRQPKDDENIQDPGCGICEALFPLCAKQWTNVDWIVLDGIQLTDVDVDYIFSAALDKSCHFRALNVGYCGLNDRNMHTLLQALSFQDATMESIDLSGNLARQNPKDLNDHLGQLGFVRRLNLSIITRTSGSDSLLKAEILGAWKLVELRLSRTTLNAETVDALVRYLMSRNSELLRILALDRCGLTSREAARLLTAMDRGSANPRDLHLDLSENRLEQHHDDLVTAVGRSYTPRHLTLQMMEYKDEINFQLLVEAFSKNVTTKILDISKLALPESASGDTCQILHELFTGNFVLEDIDISGENTHIDAVQYGNGLNHALSGLKHNKTLRILRIEHQRLRLQGASTLASVLEKNDTLLEIHCEKNEINLQAFTVLVNSLAHNTTLLYLPFMDSDRAWTQNKVDKEIDSIRDSPKSPGSQSMSFRNVTGTFTGMASSTKGTVNRTLGRTIGKTLGSQRNFSARNIGKMAHPMIGHNEIDFKAAMGSLSQNWDREIAKLHDYLMRNHNLAHGLPLDGQPLLDVDRPATADSLATALRGVSIDDRTPIAELDRQLLVDENDSPEQNDSPPAEDGDDEVEGALEMSQHSHV